MSILREPCVCRAGDNRSVKTLLLDGVGHVEAWWKARAQYEKALTEHIKETGWYALRY
eukprot:COSAG06_NODE_484_length_15127_cov_3.402116_6_plen_58_part_00